MAIKFGEKKVKRNYLFYTIITAIILCAVFLTMVGYLYNTAEDEAYENLHVQTKQIKDSITLQIISDRENLATMANFAAKLYKDGEGYNLMFESFKPIGLIENIGILNPDNVFVTKAGSIDLNGKISFEEEAQKGAYISGRIKDLTRDGYDIIRSAVPVIVNGETVGILYGVIKLDTIGEKYNAMVQEFNAQLFVYDKETGELVIDTIHQQLGNISFLKDRVYNKGYSFEEMMATDKGFTSFVSAYKDENMHLHYSLMEEIGWVIAMARYDSQVFASVHALSNVLVLTFLIMVAVVAVYILNLLRTERKISAITTCASDIRKTLLETVGDDDRIVDALKQLCDFAKGRSVVFFNTDGDEYNYTNPKLNKISFSPKERNFIMAELFRYAREYAEKNNTSVCVMNIKPDDKNANEEDAFYKLLKDRDIKEISFAATVSNANHIVVLALFNAKQGAMARMLAEKIAACFSMALYNKNRYNKTRLAATTDALTGASNRVAYYNDLQAFEDEKLIDFSCIYIDVNELHLRNNLYGHAAGDEMLIYIANTLKDVFYGNKVYRMGGDEFLVFCCNTPQEIVKKNIALFVEQLKSQDYRVSVGMSYRTQNTNTDEMVKEAEVRMYEDKAAYYQKKEKHITTTMDNEYIQLKTGIAEVDTMLSVLTENYNGIYRVSLDTDKVKRILMPKSFSYGENETDFSKLFSKYVSEDVAPAYHRAVMNFLNYDALKRQLTEGEVPKISYKKYNGENLSLSVYRIIDGDLSWETLWVFANERNQLDKGRSL